MITVQTNVTYDNDMQALTDSIRIVYHLKLNTFKELVIKYNVGFLGKPGQIDFEKLLRSDVLEVKNMLSKKYISQVLSRYYSNYGIISTIHDTLKQLYMSEYVELSQKF